MNLCKFLLLIFALNYERFSATADTCGGGFCEYFMNCSLSASNLSVNRTNIMAFLAKFRQQRNCQRNFCLTPKPEDEINKVCVNDCISFLSDPGLQLNLQLLGFRLPSYKLFWMNAVELTQNAGQKYCQNVDPRAALTKVESDKDQAVWNCLMLWRKDGYDWPYIGLTRKTPSDGWVWQDGSLATYKRPWYMPSPSLKCVRGRRYPNDWYMQDCNTPSRVSCYVQFQDYTRNVSVLIKKWSALTNVTQLSLGNLTSFERDLGQLATLNTSEPLRLKKGNLQIVKLTVVGQPKSGLIGFNGTSVQPRFNSATGSRVSLVAFQYTSTPGLQPNTNINVRSTTFFVAPYRQIFIGVAGYDLATVSKLPGSVLISRNISSSSENLKRACGIYEEQAKTSNKASILIESLEYACVFVDPVSEVYSTVGCRTSVVGNSVFCSCDHLSVFSVLLAMKTIAVPKELAILSNVCEALSVVFLVLTIAFLHIYKRQLDSDRTVIQLNISVALLSLHIVNLLHDVAVINETTCVAETAAIHFFLLASGFWLMLDGIRMTMALMFPMEFLTQSAVQRSKLFLVVWWCVPALIVVTALVFGLTSGGYMKPSTRYVKCNGLQQGIRKYDRCWLAPGTALFVLSVIVPLGIVLTVNFFASLAAANVVFRFRRREERLQQGGTKVDDAKIILRSFFVVMLLLGTSWVLGFFTGLGSGVTSLVVTYVHVVVNGLQGVVIFFFYCVRNSTINWKSDGCNIAVKQNRRE